jgi:hypothetical protein
MIWDVTVSNDHAIRPNPPQTGQLVHESEIAEDPERQSSRDKPMMVSIVPPVFTLTRLAFDGMAQ